MAYECVGHRTDCYGREERACRRNLADALRWAREYAAEMRSRVRIYRVERLKTAWRGGRREKVKEVRS